MTKRQLYEIAIDDNRSLDERYEAARKLQAMRVSGDLVSRVVRLYPHMDASDIAQELGVSLHVVIGVISKYKLYKAV